MVFKGPEKKIKKSIRPLLWSGKSKYNWCLRGCYL